MQLLFEDVWPRILRAWKTGPRYCAVAYYSCDAGLSFGKDDILVVNASTEAISTGQTDAKALRRAFESGATVRSKNALHAKVFVLGTEVFTGSANASSNSRRGLIECVASSREPHAVGDAINFVRRLADQSDVIDEEALRRLEAIEVTRAPIVAPRRELLLPSQPQRCWLLGMTEVDFPGDKDGIDAVCDEMQRGFDNEDVVDWFWWRADKSRFYRQSNVGDLFVEVWRPKDGQRHARGVKVRPPAVIHRIDLEESSLRKILFYITSSPNERSLSWPAFLQLASESGGRATPSLRGAREIPERYARTIARHWPDKA